MAKAAADHGDTHKDDRYRSFAARAAAECLIGLLRSGAAILPARAGSVAHGAGTAAPCSPPVAAAPSPASATLYAALVQLLPSQIDELLIYFPAAEAHIAGTAPASRARDLVRWLEGQTPATQAAVRAQLHRLAPGRFPQ